MMKLAVFLVVCFVSVQANMEFEKMMEQMRRSFEMQMQQEQMNTQQRTFDGMERMFNNNNNNFAAPKSAPSNYGSGYKAPEAPVLPPRQEAEPLFKAPEAPVMPVREQKPVSSYGASPSRVNIVKNLCEVNPCMNMGICSTDGISIRCECTKYFMGERCELAAPNSGRGMETFINGKLVPKVLSACEPSPCENEGVCTELGNGGFTCDCPWGFTGPKCEIFTTDCASNPCPLNKLCKAHYGGGFECVCPADRAGPNCELLNNACAGNPCQYGGKCSVVEGNDFMCDCEQPWTGKTCTEQWINPCTIEVIEAPIVVHFTNPWDRKSYLVCTDINVFNSIKCASGTYFNEKFHHCVPEGYNPPMCPADHCLNDGECIVSEMNELKCVCKKGFMGDFCEEEINECELGGNEACAGGVCIDQVNGFFCQCSNGIGENCRETIPLPCTPDNLARGLFFHELPSIKGDRYVQCLDESSWTVRRCTEGLFWHEELQTCTFERVAKKTGICSTRPCQNNGECMDNGYGSFECICKTGYTGEVCETMIDYCESMPCQNGGKCLGYAGGYTCVCPDKIVDDCCCNGIINPCPAKGLIIPGVNNYAEHLLPNKYIHCDFEGRAYVRSCSPGALWKQETMSCLSLETLKAIESQKLYEKKADEENRFNQVGKYAPKENTINFNNMNTIIPQQASSSYGQQEPIMKPTMTFPSPTRQQTPPPPPPVKVPSSFGGYDRYSPTMLKYKQYYKY